VWWVAFSPGWLLIQVLLVVVVVVVVYDIVVVICDAGGGNDRELVSRQTHDTALVMTTVMAIASGVLVVEKHIYDLVFIFLISHSQSRI